MCVGGGGGFFLFPYLWRSITFFRPALPFLTHAAATGPLALCSAKILGFDEQKREFRALYDDGTEEIESITAETYFPDPRECQRRLVHPIAPPELGAPLVTPSPFPLAECTAATV
eukprot:COSAG05_NODE_3144_length_2288_cov_2.298310_2_plen_115_part_00